MGAKRDCTTFEAHSNVKYSAFIKLIMQKLLFFLKKDGGFTECIKVQGTVLRVLDTFLFLHPHQVYFFFQVPSQVVPRIWVALAELENLNGHGSGS